MEEERLPSKSHRSRDRQPISVPFIWEDKPGIPKKHWKPTPRLLPENPIVAPPAKLVVSIPFGWEEKPGTPLPFFSKPDKQDPVFIPTSDLSYVDNDHDGWIGLSDAEIIDTGSFETYDSFSSARSTNPFVDPVRSPDSETESVDYAGTPFLEWLFPLLATNSNESKCGEVDTPEMGLQGTEWLRENGGSRAGKPLLTLEELIMMSRRRSCQRKIIQLNKQRSMDFMKGNALGCCIFGSNTIPLPLKWKRQLQIKLM
ncbi:uncharacterized protein LOC127256053 [Andrographis paniculata]|uniref:uncharacterized protein LOC127256053 n=1 Tax=Andrographis paniculata TaxID=175694 RepID=UPI0021E924D7|nr:uncharacterized protein LOC127256053 [Andrographis paniculata]